MNTMKRSFVMALATFVVCLLLVIPAAAENIEETVKYKASTMQQTIGFIDKLTGGNFGFDQS